MTPANNLLPNLKEYGRTRKTNASIGSTERVEGTKTNKMKEENFGNAQNPKKGVIRKRAS